MGEEVQTPIGKFLVDGSVRKRLGVVVDDGEMVVDVVAVDERQVRSRVADRDAACLVGVKDV